MVTTKTPQRFDAHLEQPLLLLPTRLPRELFHKTAEDQVLLTHARQHRDGRFALQGQWTSAQLLSTPVSRGADILVPLEVLRQIALCLSHRFFDIPLDSAFILDRLDFSHHRAAAATWVPSAHLQIAARCTQSIARRGRSTLDMTAQVVANGLPLGIGAMTWSVLPRRSYTALRSRSRTGLQAPPPLVGPMETPDRVGRNRQRDVLLRPSRNGCTWEAAVDPEHPVLYDHGSDHWPGMVLVEAMRQAAFAAAATERAHTYPLGNCRDTHRSITAVFTNYAEWTEPVTLTPASSPRTDGVWSVTASQGDRIVASAEFGNPGRGPDDVSSPRTQAAAC